MMEAHNEIIDKQSSQFLPKAKGLNTSVASSQKISKKVIELNNIN
jgi:hypothetical protein